MVCTCNTNTPCIYPLNNIGQSCLNGTCSSTSSVTYNEQVTQRRIWNQVRVPSSMFTMNLSALKIGSDRMNTVNGENNKQSSDQSIPSIQKNPLPSRGNSTKTTLTRLKPGACMPGGEGVDIKHNSYARYLGRKKSANLKTQPTAQKATRPLYGNKLRMIGLLSGSDNCCEKI